MIRQAASLLALAAVAQFTLPNLPVLPGSTLPLEVSGLQPPFDIAALGPASVTPSYVTVFAHPARRNLTLIAANASGVAMRTLPIAPTPDPSMPFIAVATYDDGVVIHDVEPPFKERAVLGVAGAPADVAIDSSGRIAAAATNASSASIATIAPWKVERYDNIPLVDELAFDEKTGALFLTNRDINGAGALTRITPDGTVTRRVLGQTDEGLAIDRRRGLVYVANVNDGTVSVVDATTLVERRRIRAIDRVFSLALSPRGRRLYAVSNQSVTSPFASPGGVVALDVSGSASRIVARSAPLSFPIGIALDAANKRVFVTDEHDNAVDVLNPATLKAEHAPLHTCRVPWKPLVDRGRLYVPCARSNQVDVFDTRTLQRVPGAPFATGGYPLAVAVWQGSAR